MIKPVRMITHNIEREPFEEIIRKVFSDHRDNLMCSQDILDKITKDATERIREQLQGLSRTYIVKD